MGGQVSIAEAKAGFAGLVNRAAAGETIIVTRNGRPIACLAPLPQARQFQFGDLEGLYLAEDLAIPEAY